MAALNSFPVIPSSLDLGSEQLKSNKAAWEPVLRRFEDSLKGTAAEGNAKSLSRHQSRGQILPRDRIALLLDPDSPFLELCAFAGFEVLESSPCANIIAGIGSVSGRSCLVLSHIPTQSGGAWNELTVPKQNRVTTIATENNLPIVALVQSAGVFLPQQFKVFHAGGQIFRDLAVRTQEGQHSCAVVFGSSTAGGAYHPALSDYTIFVEDQAQVFLGGPPLVKMATGEIIGAEELGGARTHASLTGLADQLATDEFDALRKAREWVASLPDKHTPRAEIQHVLPPRYSPEDLFSLVNPDIRKPFDMREVLLRIVDDSRLSIFKPSYGKNLLSAWARVHGHTVGILANQVPVIHSDEASKGAQFIRLCNQHSTPIIFLHNVTGFMVGSKAEHSGIIKKGAQMVSAVSTSKVPHLSVILGASYGAGNYAMCGRSFRPRFLFTWPSGRCSVMGGEQLAGVMDSIRRNKGDGKGSTGSGGSGGSGAGGAGGSNGGGGDGGTQQLKESVQRDGEAYRTSAALLDDGVIDPRDTRDVLGLCLDVVTEAEEGRGTETHRVLARI